jgi:hypothetical protein
MSDKKRSKEDEMIRLPPSCQVKATRPLHVPGPGKIGQVIAYVEKMVDGKPGVRVMEFPDGDIAAECDPDWLEVVSYYENVTPDFVRAALAKHAH